jgi:trehalose 6-phosphate synthase
MNRLVVVSNRVPVPSQGKQAGGLAVALDGLMQKRDDAADQPVAVERAAGVDFATVDLTPDEHARYYNSFSNAVLWPLLHGMQELMHYDREDARVYRAVNARLAAILAPMLRPADIVWVHDYHMLPMAASLAACGVKNPIGFFLHVPFPSTDVLAVAPDVAAMVRDMLAADLIGFQTENDVANFADAAELLAGASRTMGNVLHVPGPAGGRRVRLGVFPVEIDARAFAGTAAQMANVPVVESLRRTLRGQKLIAGAERLDPTKGLLQRLAGFRALLEQRPEWRRSVTMLQIAANSRQEVGSYQALRGALDRDAGSLNADFADPDWAPLRLVTRAVDRSSIAGYLREARVGLVTPLRDGMNLVAKEFVAAQDPADPGVLVLSQFAGAAQQLEAALVINPYDTEAMADALHAALLMPLAERQARWQALWGAIEHRSPVVWGESFVLALQRAATAPAERPIRAVRPDLPLGVASTVPAHLMPRGTPEPGLPLN